jgi:hypothetical protein
MVKNYDAEAHRLSPQIVGQLAVVAMLDKTVGEILAPLATRIFDLDAKVGNAVVATEGDLPTGLVSLSELHGQAYEFERTFRQQVVDLFKFKS